MDGKKTETKMSFEQGLARLEEIVALLERGEAPLDESLALYEEGAGLIKRCNAALDQAEKRVSILLQGEDGKVQEQAFDPDADYGI